MSKKRSTPINPSDPLRRSASARNAAKETASLLGSRTVVTSTHKLAEASKLGALAKRIGANVKAFSGLDITAMHLWSRWIVLRSVGLVYIFIFAGIVVEGRALVGPNGVLPLSESLAAIQQSFPGAAQAFRWAPSLFWINSSGAAVTTVSWLGLTAAVAVLLNLWPRMALFVCWASFLSFVSTWSKFSPAQIDRLLIEAALLCIPFAPSGLRPGLGAHSPPRPIALFAMRWLLFRLMFESGLVKITSEDPHWRNLTAMDVMHEFSPSPTVLGYWAHQLPHGVHLVEIALTYAAELIGPLLAIFGGRRGRWFAFICWTTLQAGIQLTGNFGWLNTAAIGLGFLLLDDSMLAALGEKLGVKRLRSLFDAKQKAVSLALEPRSRWRGYAVRAALSTQIALTIPYLIESFGGAERIKNSAVFSAVDFVGGFWSANGYYFFSGFDAAHLQVDFEGSNDGGKTWRTYPYRHIPQQVDRISGFIAPWFARFETTLQIEGSRNEGAQFLPRIAAQLLARNEEVLGRFHANPFPDRPPTTLRMRRYTLSLTDPQTLRQTRHYWHKRFESDFASPLFVDERGVIAQFSLLEADAALKQGNFSRALAIYQRQFDQGHLEAGFRLAYMHSRGLGVPAQPGRSFALFSDLAERGELRAHHHLGLCYEFGDGVGIDYAKAAHHYRCAADGGLLHAQYAFGTLCAKDRILPRADVEGLSALLKAIRRANDDNPLSVFIRGDHPQHLKRLMDRMSVDEIAEARLLAASLP